jgi:hypothetical protein
MLILLVARDKDSHNSLSIFYYYSNQRCLALYMERPLGLYLTLFGHPPNRTLLRGSHISS